jgi:hypothetical protein
MYGIINFSSSAVFRCKGDVPYILLQLSFNTEPDIN